MKRTLIIFIFVASFALNSFSGVKSLGEQDIKVVISDFDQLYLFGKAFLCDWKGGHQIDSDEDWFNIFLGKCPEYQLKNCSFKGHNSIKVEYTNRKFEIVFQNDPKYKTFKAFKIFELEGRKRGSEILSAYFQKQKCQPYSVSRITHKLNMKHIEVVTGSDAGILKDKLVYEETTPGEQHGAESSSKTESVEFLTDRSFDDYVHRLNLTSEELEADKGSKYLSVGEGNSNFISELLKRGINGTSVDATFKNVHAPEHSVIALAQALPFKDNEFKKSISVWLIAHFFKTDSINNPEAGLQALREMLRVTQIGGSVIINPIHQEAGRQILKYFADLKKKKVVDYTFTYRDNQTLKTLTSEFIESHPNEINNIIDKPGSSHLSEAVGGETNTLRVIKLK